MKRDPIPVFLRGLLILAVVSVKLAVHAQPPPAVPHTLLWRISGKGLQKPSYLYGTMHLNDKRLFQFGDSVYHAIESTEGLAIEVNPDEMAAYFVNKIFDQIENGKKLHEVIDNQYFESHRKALAKKFKKPAEEISASDVVKEKNKWMADYMQKGEMPTFMDAYLYNIARRQGKWLGGIEDIGDQTGLISDLVDQSDINYLLQDDDDKEGTSGTSSTLENMIGLYAAGNLEGLGTLFGEKYTGEEKDKVLLRRNVKMARRIDSLVALRTMVFAVGCAHLPGDSGVIDLLRRRGFTVDPVYSGKKIAANNYTFQEVRLPWTSVMGEEGTYTVQMPANPATIRLYGLVEMKFLLDLFNMSGFCTMAVISPGQAATRDSLFDYTAKSMFHGENVSQAKKLNKNGVHGKEYSYSGSDGNMRVQMFADEKMIYMALISSMKKEVLQSTDAEKFFQSFTINGLAPEPPAAASTFTDSVMGISFVTPTPLAHNEKLSYMNEDGWKISSFTGIDRSTGAVVMLMSKEIRAGYHIADEAMVYKALNDNLKKQYDHMLKDSILLDSIKVMRYTGQNIQRPDLFISGAAAVKDGRQTILMVISDSAGQHAPALQEVLSSFRFIPHQTVHWQEYASPDHAFSLYGPSPVREDHYADGKKIQWVSFDTTTATSYVVIPDTLGKYTWYKSDSIFWSSRLYSDTATRQLLEIKDVTNGPVTGKEYLVRSKGNTACSRIRILVAGDKIYKLSAAGQRPLLYSPSVNRFFETFRVDNAGEPGTITRSKAALLLHDLGSDDSATAAQAYFAMNQASFHKPDASLLRDALFRRYRSPYDTSFDATINNAIARELAGLDDSASATFVRDAYPSLVNEKRTLRNAALSVLARQHDTYSYTILARLLEQGPTGERLDYSVLYALKDSLSLTAGVFPSLRAWANDTLQATGVAFIALALADSGYLSKDSLLSYAGAFTGSAAALLPALKTNEAYQDYNLSSLIKLIGRLRTPASYALLKNYLGVKNKYLLQETVRQLIEGQQAVPPAVIRRLAGDPELRNSLYEDLKRQHKTALFPADLLTQPSFALSAVYGATEDEDEGELDKVTFLSKRTASYHGKTYLFYLYKVCFTYDGASQCYLAVAGGYDPSGAGLQPKKDLTRLYREESFEPQSTGKLFQHYLKSLDEED